ncbi:MAG: NAD(P)H-dependent glycerol-3-phosphate dehydrogenase [Pseudomonadota bacterium]
MLGAGSWGTALAMQLARNGCDVRLWGRDTAALETMGRERENARYLPDIGFPDGLEVEPDLMSAVTDVDLVVAATPSHAFADTIDAIGPKLGEGVVWASKGFEPGSGRFLHEVAREKLGPERALAVLTGPSFAREVALDLPTLVVAAATTEAFAGRVVEAFHGGSFRAYSSLDIVGAELGGAVKNVLAIATGICDGMGTGDNSRAALITRGLAEILRLAEPVGARRETLIGLSGLGDLVLTCTGDLSRNRRFGLALGRGASIEQALEEIGQVVEGISATRETVRLGRQHGVELPIAECMATVLEGKLTPEAGARMLMAREPKAEH